MTSATTGRKGLWVPPPRPEWVQKANEEGKFMNLSGVVPLTSASFIEAAQNATGLRDFGEDSWREPFEVLCKSMDEEAELNLIGRLRARCEILQHLEARLRIEQTYKDHPEIEDEQISKPLIVVGQGRSGTSFLLNVFMANPDMGVMKTWEGMFPCPPPEKASYLTDPRIEAADHLIRQNDRVTPSITSMHEFAGDLPLECLQIFGMSFTSAAWFNSMGQVPTYTNYISKVDHVHAYRYHKRVLKLLQWKNPRKHWVLKDPTHLDRMPTALKVYPDACFVWPHRDPVKALASMVSLIGTVQWGRSDHPFAHGSWDFVVDADFAASRLDAVIEQLESGKVPKSQLFNMPYADLVGDTLGAMERMYAFFGIEFSTAGRAGITQYLHENPRTARPAHQFNKGPDDMIQLERQAFRRYQEYFDVPSE